MNKLIWIATITMALNSWAQTEAVPADQSATGTTSTAAQPGQPAQAGATATAKKPVAKAAAASTTQVKKEAPKSPWGGSMYLDLSRGANISYSKLLDEDHPDERQELAAELGASLKYKFNDKTSMSVTQKLARSFYRNASDASKQDILVKNMTVSVTRKTDLKLFGSGPLAIPTIITLPTNEAARQAGLVGGLGTDLFFSWEINPTWSFSFESYAGFGFYNPQDQNITGSTMLTKSNLTLSNEIALSANATDTISIYQKANVASRSVNMTNVFGMDQQGANMGLTTGVSISAPMGLAIDVYVTQSAPLQGNGFGATKVYDDNMFKPYHEAQTSWGLTTAKTF